MKIILLAVIAAVVCVVLFIAGVISPRRSRKMQRGVDHLVEKGEERAGDNAGRLGDATEASLRKMRGASDASAQKGRDVHARPSPS